MGALALVLAALLAQSGAIATSEEQATEAAASILARGGNAVDAAIAAHFALAVTYPVAGNLGGGGFFLYRSPEGEAWYLDFRETAPAAAHQNLYRDAAGAVDREAATYGWRAVAVPGAVPGLAEAHDRWGSLPWAVLVAPAERLAREGFVVDQDLFLDLEDAAAQLALDPVARAVFYSADGSPLAPGSLCVQRALADTLARIGAEGEAALRGGALVEAIITASRAGGGILAAEDFRDYQPALRPVHRFAWRGCEVLAASPPSSGGVFLQQTLTVLEAFPLERWGRSDPRAILLIAEASAHAFADRNRWLGDPAGFDFDAAGLVAPARLSARRARLAPGHVTSTEDLAASGAVRPESMQTTHFSVTDAQGGAVSCTTTLNGGFGAKVMAPGGFLMNNEMDDFAAAPGRPNQYGLVQGEYNAIAPGHRPLSSMSPVIVMRDGVVEAVVGSPGGPRILSAVMYVLLNRYVFGLGPAEAVAAPRAHRQDLPPTLRLESGLLSPSARVQLTRWGQEWSEHRGIGDVNAIFRDGDTWIAVSDPRASGGARTVPVLR
ncbi:MAG: gamma-glutamyltransferase [Planctomycetota bacterium]|nr:gamma-glutamyltransferase [Planctomycetota bacterium]